MMSTEVNTDTSMDDEDIVILQLSDEDMTSSATEKHLCETAEKSTATSVETLQCPRVIAAQLKEESLRGFFQDTAIENENLDAHARPKPIPTGSADVSNEGRESTSRRFRRQRRPRRAQESKASNVESRADQNAEHCSENADKVQTGNKNADHGQSNSEGNQFTGSDGVQVLEVSGDGHSRPKPIPTGSADASNERTEIRQRSRPQHTQGSPEVPQQAEPVRNAPTPEQNYARILGKLLPFLVALIVLIYAIYAFASKPKIDFHKDVIHVQPSKMKKWSIKASCSAMMPYAIIAKCSWKQLKPAPDSATNTILKGGSKDCLQAASRENDASLKNLKVPDEHREYLLELSCTDNKGRNNVHPFRVLIAEKPTPVILDIENYLTISIKKGNLNLRADCQAVQGYVTDTWWEYVDSPVGVGVIKPSKSGYVTFRKPGVYKFRYRCVDSHGYESPMKGSLVTVAVRPPFVLGIDLGTSTTCVSYTKENGIKVDINLNGEFDKQPCMPSVVAFARNGSLLIGKQASDQAVVNRLSTIYEAKRLMGRSYYDVNGHSFSYTVRPTLKSRTSTGTRAIVEIPCEGYFDKLVQPELFSALILRHAVNMAEKSLGVPVNDVIISVPAQFDDAQRKATMDAGLIAGLKPEKIVNEPTVAAFAVGRFKDDLRGTEDVAELPEPENPVWSVVADIGGGTTDFALMQVKGSYYKVFTTDGNKTLGGRDIDLRLAQHVTEIFRAKTNDVRILAQFDKPKFQQRLRIECEKAKIMLSNEPSYTLTVGVEVGAQGERVLKHFLTKGEFEDIIMDILTAMVKPIDSLVARNGNIHVSNVEALYLVGGTVQIPKLKKMLTDYFPSVGKPDFKDPVQAVSRGAAEFGAVLGGIRNVSRKPHIDTIPLPINIVVDHDKMHEVFERNRLYPCDAVVSVTTFTNNQTAIVIQVYEGNCHDSDKCYFLGEFELSGIPPLAKGVPKIRVLFRVDSNGILSVTASYNDEVQSKMSLGVYSKSGSMTAKKIEELSTLVDQLMASDSAEKPKCSYLENVPPMLDYPWEANKSNVLKLEVNSEYDGVKTLDASNPNLMLTTVGMVTVKALVPNHEQSSKTADLDMLLILDKSESMGTDGRMKTMKKLIFYLINSILKENHRLGVVTFDSKASRLFELKEATGENKDRAIEIILTIQPSGETNTYEGLSAGMKMAYEGGRRACVLLFTDGDPSVGKYRQTDEIVREILKETKTLKERSPTSQVDLHTFGVFGYEDGEDFLLKLARSFGEGEYHKVDEGTELAKAFAHVVSNAIHKIADDIELSISPSNGVRIQEAMTNVRTIYEADTLIMRIPSMADQQVRHVLLELAVPPAKEKTNYEELFRVDVSYTNLVTQGLETYDEYLYVSRTEELDEHGKNRDVVQQLDRVEVARAMEQALSELREDNPQDALECLKEAQFAITKSRTKDQNLSMCLQDELERLIQRLEFRNPNDTLRTIERSLEESVRSHWKETGGRSSCYVTRKEDTMITIFGGENI